MRVATKSPSAAKKDHEIAQRFEQTADNNSRAVEQRASRRKYGPGIEFDKKLDTYDKGRQLFDMGKGLYDTGKSVQPIGLSVDEQSKRLREMAEYKKGDVGTPEGWAERS